MKVAIEVKNRQEGSQIKLALEDQEVRAFLNVVGALLPLSPSARRRALAYVTDRINEGTEVLTTPPAGV